MTVSSPEKLSLAGRVQLLESRLGVTISRQDLAIEALTHKTYVNENPDLRLKDNQRLEFFGDAVVNLAVADRLWRRYPDVPEGFLTKVRARLVHEEGLALVARRIPLGDLLLLGRGEDKYKGREKNSLLADAMEAVFGAVYLSGGMEPVLQLVDRFFAELIDEAATSLDKDYKTALGQLVHERLKMPPKYRVVSESGPEHSKTFEVEVIIGEEPFARATGRSKKEAEQAAARVTLDMFSQRLAPNPAPAPASEPSAPTPDETSRGDTPT
ncbi:ribonuclease III [Pyxidicoccus trucidator]|uniref:ribonuclease III n=1 Tax=Pyxidicoccus trucidator TaxID=2709662 RepID=UPI0013D9B0BA|nr:ribonuclease III [Pyxidicoccus trucidator]